MKDMKMWAKQKKSITRELHLSPISLKEFYKKVENQEFQHHIKLLREKAGRQKEVFKILTVLGKGRTSFTFLSLYDKKFTALRMSYDDEDFTGKFDSVIELMGEDYKQSFLDVLYPSMPVQGLYYRSLKKKNEILFDKTVYVSFWEKAAALLEDKLDESFEKKFKWFREFLKGLSIIHAKNRAHFDIKLENLFLVDDRLKIGDFEFYWKVRDFIDSKEYLYCGSIGYIAPEMFYNRENITSKVDIFSAGVAFARLFAGETYQKIKLNPEENQQLKEILQKCESLDRFDRTHMAEIKESLRHSFFYRRLVKDKIKKEGLDPTERFLYEEILLDMMGLDPGNRIDIYEIIDKLGIKEPTIKEGGRIVDVEPRKPSNLRGWWFIIGFLVTAAAGLFFYFFVYNQGKAREPPPPTNVKLTIKTPVAARQKAPHEAPKEKTNKPTREKVEDIPKKDEPVETVKPPPAKVTKPEISPEEEKEKLRNQARYDAYLDIAKDLVKGKEYKKALDMIARAREIKETDELLEWEQTIKRLMEKELQDSYKKFYQEAQRSYRQGDYEEALMNIEIARKIKDTPQLASLELQVKRKIKERDEEYERGLALVQENIVDGDYTHAKELINALKKIKADERLLKLEKEVNRELVVAAQQRQEESEYIKTLQKAQEYMDDGDYEKAEAEIKKARKVKNNELLKRLEEKLKDLKEQTQQEYEKYTRWARVYFLHGQLEKAQHYLELAKNIYPSRELLELEREILEKTRDQEQKEAGKEADDEAYLNAIRGGEVWNLDEYIRKYPYGRHVREVKRKLDRMLEDLIPMVKEPRWIRKVEPVYPRRAIRKRVSGIVRLEVVIDMDGNVTEVEVTDGHILLRHAAKKAVKKWKYEPFIIGGEPRSVWFTVKVVFELPGD
ncbi:MAG: TonB family protein [Candidatus Aminicenantes bacterium]|nr:MAG: TonB family protein [Candidatus Aminicenantes bacterium]